MAGEHYECQELQCQVLRTAISLVMIVSTIVVELYMFILQQYPLVIVYFNITEPTEEEQSMLSHHISQLMDQHLTTTEHIDLIIVMEEEEEFILPHQLLRLTTQHSAGIMHVGVEERSTIIEETFM